MSEFTLNASLELQGVNARKEGANDDKHTAVDLKFCGPVDINDLMPLTGAASAFDLADALWSENTEDMDVRLPNVAEVKPHSSTEFEGLNCTAFGTKIVEARAHKFSFKPHAGGADLTFTLSIPDPSQEVLPIAARALGENVRLQIQPAQMEMPMGQEESETAE